MAFDKQSIYLTQFNFCYQCPGLDLPGPVIFWRLGFGSKTDHFWIRLGLRIPSALFQSSVSVPDWDPCGSVLIWHPWSRSRRAKFCGQKWIKWRNFFFLKIFDCISDGLHTLIWIWESLMEAKKQFVTKNAKKWGLNVGHEIAWIRIWIRIDFKSWIWIRVRIEF